MKFKKIKQNRGTALVLAITLVTVISLLGLTLVSVTFSTFETAISKSDQNSSYFAGEAGVQKIMSILDKKVGDFSEDAKEFVSVHFTDRNTYRNLYNSNNVAYPWDDFIDIDLYRKADGSYDSGYSTKYNTEINEYFDTLVDTYFDGIGADLAKQKVLLDTAGEESGKAMAYVDTDAGTTKKVIIEACTYNSATNKLTVKVKSTYNSYPKTIQVVFTLQPYASYFKPTESINAKAVSSTRHEILQKAIVAEKNLIANEGTITINGDVLAFGTVPQSEGVEDFTKDWEEFGGILIGMSDRWRSNFALFGISNEADLDNNKYATVEINGDAATMANIGVLYSSSGSESTLTVQNGAFARNINAFASADYSTINIEDAYVNDNLGIDADNVEMNIHDLYGVVEHGYDIDGVIGDVDDGIEDTQSPKRTSSVVITGDSTLDIDGEIYIAGSGFFENLADSSGSPYMAGISGIKATAQLERAFQKDEESIVNGSGNTPIYWWDGSSLLSLYDNEDDHTTDWKSYEDDSFSFDMIDGLDGDPNFSLEKRGIHFREIWENHWGLPGSEYNDYVAFGNIKGKTVDGKVVGYAAGAVALRNESDVDNIYAGTDAFSKTRGQFKVDIQKPALRSFYDQIKGLVNEPYSASSPKLNYVEPNKHIDDIEYRDTSYVGAGMIESDEPYSTSKGFVYFNSSGSDISIANDAGTWKINGTAIPLVDGVKKGIIVVDGNLFIENGFEFTGVILCKKNVIFQGSGTTEISYDDTVVSDLLASDVVVNGFFGNLTYKLTDTGDNSYDLRKKSQRLQQKAVTIESMNEVD